MRKKNCDIGEKQYWEKGKTMMIATCTILV